MHTATADPPTLLACAAGSAEHILGKLCATATSTPWSAAQLCARRAIGTATATPTPSVQHISAHRNAV